MKRRRQKKGKFPTVTKWHTQVFFKRKKHKSLFNEHKECGDHVYTLRLIERFTDIIMIVVNPILFKLHIIRFL